MKKINFLMLLALVFLLFGCREELDYLNGGNTNQNSYQLNKDNVKTQILQKSDYQSKSFLKPNVELVQTFLQQHNGSASGSLSKNSGTETPEIFTDVFEEVSYLNAKYYSFYITEISPEGFEQKLILKYVDNQLAGKYILKYKRLNDFKIDPYSYQLEKLVQSSNDNENSLIISTISLSVGCTNYKITTFDCGYKDHHSNGEKCTTTGIIMPYDVVSSVYTANCQPGNSGGGLGSGDGSGGDPSTGGGTVGGGFENTPTPEIITIPTSAPLYIIQRPKGKICNTLNLDTEEISQINSNYNVRLRIYQYLALSGINPQLCDGILTPEAEDFVKAALQYFKNHPNANWQDYYNEFLATPCEKTKNIITNPKMQAGFQELKTQSTQGGEKGIKFKADGTPSATITGGKHSVNFGDKTGYTGGYHNHTPTGIPMLSPPDVDQLLGFARAQPTSDPNNVNNAYLGMIAPNGMHYVIWFNGTYQDTTTSFSQDQLDGLGEDYSELASDLTTPLLYGQTYRNSDGSINNLGVEKLFFITLKKMGLEGKVNLQRIDTNGIQNINLDSNNTPNATPCS